MVVGQLCVGTYLEATIYCCELFFTIADLVRQLADSFIYVYVQLRYQKIFFIFFIFYDNVGIRQAALCLVMNHILYLDPCSDADHSSLTQIYDCEL